MNVNIGIVAEYNPFHAGHAWQIGEIKKYFGPDCAITAVMSGDFVQRGEPAIFSKYARAEAACRCGIDLVAELPVQWSVASAGRFAEGAVNILLELGITHLVFGSETGDIEGMKKAADILMDDGFHSKVKILMSQRPNLSYPSAREIVFSNEFGTDIAKHLRLPNDSLGVEYIKTLRTIEKKSGKKIEPIAVKRNGAGHDECVIFFSDGEIGDVSTPIKGADPGIASASYIRSLLRAEKNEDAYFYVPQEAAAIYAEEQCIGRGPVFMSDLENAVLSRMMLFLKEYFSSLPDGGDGAGNRLYEAIKTSCCFDDIINHAKTKRFTHSRLRRLSMQACLGISGKYGAEKVSSGNKANVLPPYARILAFNEKGREIMAVQRKNTEIPIIIRGKDAQKYGSFSKEVFAIGASAHDFYSLAFHDRKELKFGSDYRFNPFFVQNDEKM